MNHHASLGMPKLEILTEQEGSNTERRLGLTPLDLRSSAYDLVIDLS